MSTKSFSSHLGGFAFQWGKLALGYKVGENTVPSEQQGEYSPNGPDQTINLSSSAISVNNGQWVPGSVCAMRSSTGIDQLKFISHDGTIDSTLEIGMTAIMYTSSTYAEVQAALLASKVPVLYIGQTANTYLPLIARNNQLHTYAFGAVNDASRLVLYTLDDQNNWTHEIIGLPASDTIAPVFSAGTTYHKDNLVYNKFDKLYRCVVNNSTPSAWVPAEWVQTTVADELARLGENNMKTLTLLADGNVTYTFTGSARAATFTKTQEVLELVPMSNGTANQDFVGFGTGDKVRIVGAQIKAGAAPGLQSPAMAAAPVGLCAALQFDVVALASDGTLVQNMYVTSYLKELDWNTWEKKDIEIEMPSALPVGATCFGIRYSGTFTCDDYNIQSDYVGQTVTPELVLEIATESETVVDVATGTEIAY